MTHREQSATHLQDDRLIDLYVDGLALPPQDDHVHLRHDEVGHVDVRTRDALLLVGLHVHEHHVIGIVVRELPGRTTVSGGVSLELSTLH